MTPADLAAAEEVLRLDGEATPKPWRPLAHARYLTGVHSDAPGSTCKIYHAPLADEAHPDTHARQRADAALTAAYRTLAPQLARAYQSQAAEVERLTRERDEARKTAAFAIECRDGYKRNLDDMERSRNEQSALWSRQCAALRAELATILAECDAAVSMGTQMERERDRLHSALSDIAEAIGKDEDDLDDPMHFALTVCERIAGGDAAQDEATRLHVESDALRAELAGHRALVERLKSAGDVMRMRLLECNGDAGGYIDGVCQACADEPNAVKDGLHSEGCEIAENDMALVAWLSALAAAVPPLNQEDRT